ncbi:lipopolysaccharide biosynthesis protein [Aurantiacibacter poecillastricola]|uniref:lipopolysaccharide biosynthesis protein n=1 Tax=Aurantiacibacter poecillastricola TaxID=3064385 RepID=UPI00273E4F73|nr:lipopolysaccharide biosynthesis protein [Aurantiacibacter sp. 219JJ12-13]MDP5262587.1 lipopolysaccharide biosynthesis protein [Aurantiacibacter sp. 219JJ12-13]
MGRSIASSWSKLVGSNVVGGAMQFIAVAIAARALSLEAFGMIVLIQTYAKVVDALLNFQSVNVLTHFLADAQERDDRSRFAGLLKAGLLVDLGTALFATVLAAALLPVLAPVFGLAEEWIAPGMLFCLVILTRIFGVTEAYLRCHDRFWLVGARPVLAAGLTAGGSLFLWLAGADARAFLLLWMLAEVMANLFFIGATWHAIRRDSASAAEPSSAREAIAASAGFWPMMWQTNATTGIRMLTQDIDVLFAGSVFGPTGASLLRVAKSLANQVGQLARALQQVVSAPISRMVTRGDLRAVTRYSTRVAMLAGGGGLALATVMFAVGQPILVAAFGSEFAPAYWLTVLLFTSRGVYLAGVTLLPTMLALDISGLYLRSVILGTLAFGVVLAIAVPAFGLAGIAISHIVFEVVWFAACWLAIHQRVAGRGLHSLTTARGSS